MAKDLKQGDIECTDMGNFPVASILPQAEPTSVLEVTLSVDRAVYMTMEHCSNMVAVFGTPLQMITPRHRGRAITIYRTRSTDSDLQNVHARWSSDCPPEQNAEAAAILRSQTVFAVRLADNGWSTVRCAQRRLWLAGHTSNTGYSLACELAETFQAHSTALLQTDRIAMLLLSI